MCPVDDLNDDYVASLLLKDAQATRKPSVANSISNSKRKPDAPKPNLSFLRNVLRETDSHNAALKAKEKEESRARLRDLKSSTRENRKRKRDPGEDVESEARSNKRVSHGERSGRWASALAGLGTESQTQRRSKHRGGNDKDGGRADRDYRDRRKDRERGERHSETDKSGRRHRREKHDHRRRSLSRSHSPDERKAVHRTSSSGRKSCAPARGQDHSDDRRSAKRDSDSDPLDDFLGPQRPPAVLPRGRGALRPSRIDSRFQPNYDPSTDVHLEHDYERDDWDMALEALQDRAKWKAQGSERLRAAGFTDEEVRKWEKGGNGEKDVEDVRWKKKGERREWDRGKILEGDGVRLKAEW